MSTRYEIRVAGHLDHHWSSRLGSIAITHHDDGTSTLTGAITDQAHLYGILTALRDLGVTLLSVHPCNDLPTPHRDRAEP